MKVCIPTLDALGLAAELADHFGKAPHLTLLDVDSGQAGALESDDPSEHDCGRIGLLEGQRLDAVVVHGGIGRGAYAALAERGIPVLVSSGKHVSEVLAEARAGRLRRLDVGQTCSHHQHHGGGGCRH